MRVYRCDRCGANYKDHAKGTRLEIVKKRPMKNINADATEQIDLCDSCQRQLRNWLREGNVWQLEHTETEEA